MVPYICYKTVFVVDKDLHGRNVLLLTSFLLRELLRYPREILEWFHTFEIRGKANNWDLAYILPILLEGQAFVTWILARGIRLCQGVAHRQDDACDSG